MLCLGDRRKEHDMFWAEIKITLSNIFVYLCVCICARERLRLTLNVSLDPSQLLRQGLSVDLEFMDLPSLLDQQSPGIHPASASPVLRWQVLGTRLSCFYVGAGEPTQVLMFTMESTILTEPSPQTPTSISQAGLNLPSTQG